MVIKTTALPISRHALKHLGDHKRKEGIGTYNYIDEKKKLKNVISSLFCKTIASSQEY